MRIPRARRTAAISLIAAVLVVFGVPAAVLTHQITKHTPPPTVVVAGWEQSAPHNIYNGMTTVLKGTVLNSDGTATYTWDFGDGSPVQTGQVSNPEIIEADHVYPNEPDGTPFTAVLTVTQDSGTSSAQYPIVVYDNNLSTQVNVAIDNGLWNLHKQLIRSTFGNGVAFAYEPSADNYLVAATALSAEAFEQQGHYPIGNPITDPYVSDVQDELMYLFNMCQEQSVSPNGHPFNPDVSGTGIGLVSYEATSSDAIYESSMAATALALSQDPDAVVPAGIGPADVAGQTYKHVLQDMVDFLLNAQNVEGSSGDGGWRYMSQYGSSDMSNTQWPVVAFEAAEAATHENPEWGVTDPPPVKTELENNFLTQVQDMNTGSFGYDAPDTFLSEAETGSGISCLAWTGVSQNDPRYVMAEQWMANNWAGNDGGWVENLGDFYDMYGVMKGSRLSNPEIVIYADPGQGLSYDWYNIYATYLVSHQAADGSWTDTSNLSSYMSPNMATSFAILILTPTVVTPPPVAVLSAAPNPTGVGIPVTFDGSKSYDNDMPPLPLTTYAFSYGDNASASGQVSITQHTYSADGTYNACLIVTNSAGESSAASCVTVYVTSGDHPPTSVPGGPYLGVVGVPVLFDGSGSYDIDASHGDTVTLWDWQFKGPPYTFSDATGPTATWTYNQPGTYNVGLLVRDKPGVFPRLAHDRHGLDDRPDCLCRPYARVRGQHVGRLGHDADARRPPHRPVGQRHQRAARDVHRGFQPERHLLRRCWRGTDRLLEGPERLGDHSVHGEPRGRALQLQGILRRAGAVHGLVRRGRD